VLVRAIVEHLKSFSPNFSLAPVGMIEGKYCQKVFSSSTLQFLYSPLVGRQVRRFSGPNIKAFS